MFQNRSPICFLFSTFLVFAHISVVFCVSSISSNLTDELDLTINRPTLSPGPSPRSKWGIGQTPGQGCWNTPFIVEYFITWHMMKLIFRKLFPASGGPVCFLQSETVIQTKRRYFIVFAWQNSNELSVPLWQPWPGVSPIRHFELGEGPEDEVETDQHENIHRSIIYKKLQHWDMWCSIISNQMHASSKN